MRLLLSPRTALASHLAAMTLCLPLSTLAAPQPFMAGAPYQGDVTLGVVLPDGRTHTKTTHGSIAFTPDPNQTDVVQMVMRADESDAGASSELILFGTYEDGGWHTLDDVIDVKVQPNGQIRGTGDDDDKQFLFSGTASATRLQLNKEILLVTEQGGAPAGTRLTFSYTLTRP